MARQMNLFTKRNFSSKKPSLTSAVNEEEFDFKDNYVGLEEYVTPGQPLSPTAKIYLVRHKLKAIDIKATGRRGMLLKQDIVRFLKDPIKYANKQAHHMQVTPSTSEPISVQWVSSEFDQVVKLNTGMRKRMSQIMTKGLTAPYFVLVDQYDVTDLLEFEKNSFSKMTMILKSISIALIKFPKLNTIVNPQVDEDGYVSEYVIKKDHNISIAHSTPEGLSLPYIPKVQNLKLSDIEKALPSVTGDHVDEDKSQESTFTIYFNDFGKNLYPNIISPQT
jgi:pyruvate/2-oxoglutarate dehydrogenase complex dihydrolipoamide acyltransferase (E2) component